MYAVSLIYQNLSLHCFHFFIILRRVFLLQGKWIFPLLPPWTIDFPIKNFDLLITHECHLSFGSLSSLAIQSLSSSSDLYKSWSPRKTLLDSLEVFLHRGIRRILHIKMCQVINQHINKNSLVVRYAYVYAVPFLVRTLYVLKINV